MMNFALIAALLCTYSWISVSVSEFHTVEVRPGQEVTLMCSNFTSFPTYVIWFKLDNRLNTSCISHMTSSDGNTSYCDGFQNDKFNMTSNAMTLFLEIKRVDLSDSGLYFCGFNSNNGDPVIVSATYLKVQVFFKVFDGKTNLTSVILGALIIVLIMVVIALVVKIRKLQTAHDKRKNPQDHEKPGSDDLNYAALSFRPKPKVGRSPPSENELNESNVVYAATR